MSRLEDINKSCLEEFRKHWECLDDNNQQLWQCRKFERGLNKCVFEKLVRIISVLSTSIVLSGVVTDIPFVSQKMEKTIPGTPENETPVHLRKKQIFAHSHLTQ